MRHELDLFEYTEYRNDLPEGLDKNELEDLLNEIWRSRARFVPFDNLRGNWQGQSQRFIDLYSKNGIKPRNWIGTIHLRNKSSDYVFNLFPKIFYKEDHVYNAHEKNSIYAHVLWWLSCSEKQNYSSLESSFEALQTDLLEVMVQMFSDYTLEIFSTHAYQYYCVLEEDVDSLRGQINFNSYLNNYATGNRQKLNCVYDSFQYDNTFNRIVKYVATLLKNFTKSCGAKTNLEELLFILDEVEYTTVTIEDCDKIVLNPIHTEFKTVLDSCRLFLSSLTVYKWKSDYDVFALLIPAEKLFENFIYSVLDKHQAAPIASVSRNRPYKRNYLVRRLPAIKPDRYKMINDIVVGFEDGDFILLDTKYKRIYNLIDEDLEDAEPYYNISQTDIYQMVSYAISSNIEGVGLCFPRCIDEYIDQEMGVFGIEDLIAGNKMIRIHPFKVDVIHKDQLALELKGKLEDEFSETENRLANQILKYVLEIKNYKLLV